MIKFLAIGGILLYLISRKGAMASPGSTYLAPSTTGYVGGLLPGNSGSPIANFAPVVQSGITALEGAITSLSSIGTDASGNTSSLNAFSPSEISQIDSVDQFTDSSSFSTGGIQ